MKSFRAWGVAGMCLLLAGAAAAPARAEAPLLVRWDGAYMTRPTGGEKLNLSGESSFNGPDGAPAGIGFSGQDMPISPDGKFYDATRPSARFYGLLEMENPTRAAVGDISAALRSLNTVSANHGRNIVNFACVDPAEGGRAVCRGLVYWRVEDSPLAGRLPEALTWADFQSLSVEVAKINNKLSHFQFAVQSGGKWYLSESRGDRTGWTSLSDSSWAEWAVGSGFPLPAFPEVYPVRSVDLKDITAVGLAFSAGSAAVGANAVFGFWGFYAELNPGVVR